MPRPPRVLFWTRGLSFCFVVLFCRFVLSFCFIVSFYRFVLSLYLSFCFVFCCNDCGGPHRQSVTRPHHHSRYRPSLRYSHRQYHTGTGTPHHSLSARPPPLEHFTHPPSSDRVPVVFCRPRAASSFKICLKRIAVTLLTRSICLHHHCFYQSM